MPVKPGFNIYWYMLDIDNYNLITSPICIPGDIRDTKGIVLTETPVPGLNYQPITYGGGGNRKLSFTLPLIKRNNDIGNLQMLKVFDSLRNQAQGFTNIFSGQFTPTPRVLYQWGTGSVPLIYWVAKCDPTNKQGWVNRMGFPQYSEIEFELWLDETNPLYLMEEVYRMAMSKAAQVGTAMNILSSGKPL